MAKNRKTKRTAKVKRARRPKGKRAPILRCDVTGCGTDQLVGKCQHCGACMCEGHVAAGYVCCEAGSGASGNPAPTAEELAYRREERARLGDWVSSFAGPYSDPSAAHEKALKLKSHGAKNVRIDKDQDGLWRVSYTKLLKGTAANPPRYTGPIKSKKGAEDLANRLDRINTPEARAAANQLRDYWQHVAQRPELGQSYEAMAGRVKLTKGEKAALKAVEARVDRASRAYHSDMESSPQDAERRRLEYDAALAARDYLRSPNRGDYAVIAREREEERLRAGMPAQIMFGAPDPRREALLGTATTPAVASFRGVLIDSAARGRLQAEARAFGHTLVDSSMSCLRCGLPLDQAVENTCAHGSLARHHIPQTAEQQRAHRERQRLLAEPAVVQSRAERLSVNQQTNAGFRSMAEAQGHQVSMIAATDLSNGIDGAACFNCDMRGPNLSIRRCPAAGSVEVFPVAAPAWAPPPPPVAALAGTGVERLASSIAAERIVAPSRATPEWVGRFSAQPEAVAARQAAEAARLQRAAEFKARGARPAGAAPPPPPYVPAPGGAERFRGLEFDPGAPVQHDVSAEAGAERFRGLELWNPPRLTKTQHDMLIRMARAPHGVDVVPGGYAGAGRDASRWWTTVRILRNAGLVERAGEQSHRITDAGRAAIGEREVRQNGPTYDRPGYPFADRQAMYADMDTETLQWHRADAIMARDNAKGWNAVGEAWYQDDAVTIGDELRKRGAYTGDHYLKTLKNREWRQHQAMLAERHAKEVAAAAYAAPGAERFKGLELGRPGAYGEVAGGAERFRGLELSNPGYCRMCYEHPAADGDTLCHLCRGRHEAEEAADEHEGWLAEQAAIRREYMGLDNAETNPGPDERIRAMERAYLQGGTYDDLERVNEVRVQHGLGRLHHVSITQHHDPRYKTKWKGDGTWTSKAKALASRVGRPLLGIDAFVVDELAHKPGSWDTVLVARYLVPNDRAAAEEAQRQHMAAFEALSPSDKIARMTMNNPFFAPPALQYVAFANPPGDEEGWT